MIRRSFILLAAFAALALGVACNGDDDPAPEATATQTEAAPTETSTPPATATSAESPAATAVEPSASPTTESTTAATEAPSGDACASLAPEAEDASFVFVTTLASGDTLESGATVEGCSRTFESNVPWSLVDREGNVLVESFSMGGGVDGPAPFEFTVEYEVTEAQVGHLFVGGNDPSDGEGFPPVTNQIPVVLLP